MVADGAEHFESMWVIDGGLYPGHAAFVIHLHTVGLQFEIHPAANGTVLIVGDCLSLKPRVRFASHEGKDICACEVIECVSNQRRINILKETAFLKHDIGCEFALVTHQ